MIDKTLGEDRVLRIIIRIKNWRVKLNNFIFYILLAVHLDTSV